MTRIVSWNCATGFAAKRDAVLTLKPDLLVVPECSRLDAERETKSGLSRARSHDRRPLSGTPQQVQPAVANTEGAQGSDSGGIARLPVSLGDSRVGREAERRSSSQDHIAFAPGEPFV